MLFFLLLVSLPFIVQLQFLLLICLHSLSSALFELTESSLSLSFLFLQTYEL